MQFMRQAAAAAVASDNANRLSALPPPPLTQQSGSFFPYAYGEHLESGGGNTDHIQREIEHRSSTAASSSSDGIHQRNPFVNVSLGSGNLSLPYTNSSAPAPLSQSQRQRAWRKRWWWQISLRCVALFLSALAWCIKKLMPRMGERRVEENAPTHVEVMQQRGYAFYVRHWRRILCYAVSIVVGFAVLVVCLWFVRPESAYLAARRSDRILRLCGNTHDDRLRVLKEPALEVTRETLSSGVLPCGTLLSSVMTGLQRLHLQIAELPPLLDEDGHIHNDTYHNCLTAKHLNHSYAVISVFRGHNSTPEVFFNPELYSPITEVTSAATSIVQEHSDFFPRAGTLNRTRHNHAFLTVTRLSGLKERLRRDTNELHCIIYAWEILGREHYQVWTTTAGGRQ